MSKAATSYIRRDCMQKCADLGIDYTRIQVVDNLDLNVRATIIPADITGVFWDTIDCPGSVAGARTLREHGRIVMFASYGRRIMIALEMIDGKLTWRRYETTATSKVQDLADDRKKGPTFTVGQSFAIKPVTSWQRTGFKKPTGPHRTHAKHIRTDSCWMRMQKTRREA